MLIAERQDPPFTPLRFEWPLYILCCFGIDALPHTSIASSSSSFSLSHQTSSPCIRMPAASPDWKHYLQWVWLDCSRGACTSEARQDAHPKTSGEAAQPLEHHQGVHRPWPLQGLLACLLQRAFIGSAEICRGPRILGAFGQGEGLMLGSQGDLAILISSWSAKNFHLLEFLFT